MVPMGMLALTAAATAWAFVSGTPTDSGGGLYLDVLNLQWWQAIMAIAVALGVSPAPWITALATGRLLFRADLERQIKKSDTEHEKALAQQKAYYEALLQNKDQRYAELSTANQGNVQAAAAERDRANEITDAALEMAEVIRANNHFLESFGQAQRIAEGTAQNGT